MRRITESGAVLDAIATATHAPRQRVAVVVAALRDAIDGLFLDGYTIFAPPFSLTYPDDPVAPVFAAHIEEASDHDIEAWYVGNLEAAAEWLSLPYSTYLRHPVASELLVFTELFDGLDIEDAESPDGAEAVAIARAWFDTFTEERPYRLSTVGLERDLEAWLIHHPERLAVIGYDVRLRHQQLVLPDRRRPDLVFDLIEDDGSTGTLIVELKAVGGYLEAVDQIVGYLDAFRSLGIATEPLRGLLLADGFTHDVLLYADQKGIDTATLTEIGYRRDLASARATTTITATAGGGTEHREGNTVNDNNPNKTPTFYLAWGTSLYAAEAWEDDAPDPTPFLRIGALGLTEPVIDVEPVGTPGWEYTAARTELLAGALTPTQWQRFFGMACYLLPANDAAEDAVTEWNATHGAEKMQANQGVQTDADGSDGTGTESGVRAMQAAADFVRAAWKIRKDITYLTPRELADWLASAPDELRGDAELPDHIQVAADALEGLAAAILDGATPDYYDGGATAFLADAERTFRSVTKRLQHITPLRLS